VDTKKEQIKKLVMEMAEDSHKRIDELVDKALKSGAVDTESWDPNYAPMVLPKSILVAILETEARQYSAVGTSFEKQAKKEVKNLRYFL
jgi:hypothetical protein